VFKKVLMVLVVMTLAGGGRVWAADGMLTILHTSQLQGRFQQIMKVGALKEQIQKETGAVVLFDAGNSFSSQEMIFEHPEGKVSPTVDMMTRAGYDAWVLGQAETQIDLDFLSQALRNAQFSVLGANLHRPQNGRLLFQVQPYAVIQAGRFRVGVLGLGQGGKGVQAGDAVLAAKYYVPLIKQQADVVVLLTHLGFPADSTLAEQVADVDLIVGNYSETAEGRSAQVNGVTIRQAGPWGQSAGRIDLRIGQDGVTVQHSQLIPLDIPMGSIDAMTVALSAWTLPILGEPMSVTAALGTSAGGFGASIGQAGAMGYLVSDLMRASVQADIALVSATSLDSELPEGAVRVQDVYRIYAPDHRVVVVEMRGEELSHLMEEGLDDLRAFFYPSGLQVVYDLTKLRGQRLVSLMDGARHPLNLRKKFKVAVESDVVPFIQKEKIGQGEKIRDIITRHIREAGVIQGRLDDRMQER
jgi:2',3'-cyclic-nucleotide 2'-phosphodiesterase (5'-nucleotidase family)